MTAELLALLILIALSGIFSGTETAFTSLSFIQVKELEQSRKKSAHIAAELARRSDLLLTTILIGNNLVNIAASALLTAAVIRTYGNTAVGYATGILTLIILIFAEITPKQIAIVHNKRICMFMAYPVRALTILLYPLVYCIKGISSALSRIFVRGKKDHISLEGILHVMDMAQDQGVVEDYESHLVQKVFRFDDIDVHSIMTHRTDVVSISGSMRIDQALSEALSSGFSRIPVYQDTPEHIIGVVLARDLMQAVLDGHKELTADQLALPPIFVPETRKVHEMFFIFKKKKLHLAVVLDEYGGLAGVVTLEDVIEELFGELYDENESGATERIQPLADETYRIIGDTPIQQVEDYFDFDLEHSRHVGTISGYLIEQTGSIPEGGLIIETEIGTFKIESMKGNRINTIIFLPLPLIQE